MGFLTPIMSFLSLGNSRKIQNITGYITISENTTDKLEITKQPVQQGAMITDHSFKIPTQLSVQIQFSSATLSSAIGSAVGSVLPSALSSSLGIDGNGTDSLSTTYQKLLDLQSSREPFDIVTPKRTYKNMLFETLSQTTDKRTENVLSISASFTQIVIVSVTASLVPRLQLKTPGLNGAIEQAGKKSALLTGASGIVAGITGFSR